MNKKINSELDRAIAMLAVVKGNKWKKEHKIARTQAAIDLARMHLNNAEQLLY